MNYFCFSRKTNLKIASGRMSCDGRTNNSHNLIIIVNLNSFISKITNEEHSSLWKFHVPAEIWYGHI